ncbi:MAG: sigma-70 family RNA polymerase sigma factor [Bacteroidota bacterium]
MKRAADSKQELFKNVMVPFMDLLYGYAMYLTGGREEANDLLQETYLKAFRFFDRFEQGTNAKAWLYRIMRNTYINDYRRVKRLPDLVEYDEQISAYQMSSRDEKAPDAIEGELFGDEIAQAIASLPEKFKSVIVLRDVEDLPYEEIAETLDIPIGTVRSRLHRARGILFDTLRGYAEERGYAVTARPALALAV